MRRMPFVGAVWLSLVGTLAPAQSVTFDFDKTTDFSRVRTYAWGQGTELRDPLNHKRIVEAVEAQLASKGLARVDVGAYPDVLVAYHASFDQNLEIRGLSSGWGGYRVAGTRSGTARVEEVVSGTLVVEVLDAGTHAVVWRGIAHKDVDLDASPEKREKSIRKAAEKIFKHYPPAD